LLRSARNDAANNQGLILTCNAKQETIRKNQNMGLIKKFKLAIAVVLPILILVLIRSLGVSHFKNDARKWAEPSIDKSNIISIKQAGSLKGKVLMICLDKDGSRIMEVPGDSRIIPPDSILNKNYESLIMKHIGPVLLCSSDRGLSARIWMLLSQMGCKNIYILTDSTDNEVFKYKFRPDTLLN
jgi:hypothetical protein